MRATQPGDGAELLPGVIERASVHALAAGKQAADLCLEVFARFADAPKSSSRFKAIVSAKDGTGT